MIWEAQYGDFINGAQTMLDEFVLSARAKWGQEPSLVLLLPHGYEGQGPDHASARPERFLQLAADINMRVANCTTAAQYFHLLRRQAALLETDPLPLVVLTPKSLLRHPFVVVAPDRPGGGQLAAGDRRRGPRGEREGRAPAGALLRQGRRGSARRAHCAEQSTGVAICRVEQLYPLPVRDILAAIERYPTLEEVVWVQEEPENMGAWEFVRPSLEGLAGIAPALGARAAAQLEPGGRIRRAARADSGRAATQALTNFEPRQAQAVRSSTSTAGREVRID